MDAMSKTTISASDGLIFFMRSTVVELIAVCMLVSLCLLNAQNDLVCKTILVALCADVNSGA